MGDTLTNLETYQQPLKKYQRWLLRSYGVGYLLMVAFNWVCYPGTFIGIFGWAIVWPLYIPALLVRLWLFGDGSTVFGVCPGPIAGVR